jgi:twitching motility protein PilT
MTLVDLLDIMLRGRASDLFLKTGAEPAFRVDGEIRRDLLPESARGRLDAASVEQVTTTVLSERLRESFNESGEADAAYEVARLGRFRVNVFRQRGTTGVVFRHLPYDIPSFAELHLPAKQLKKLCAMQRGLVLITGIAGSGKSTCLAAMVDYINENFRRHIVTIEDPIEFVHGDKKSLIEQREVGVDTSSFTNALKYCLRQSPDVILLGEMRDQETMEAAINAAETGHLVLSTLHTVNAVQTVERIIGYFPPHLHRLVRMQLALVLEGAVSLRLLRLKGRPGRVPAAEVLLGTPSVRELLDEGKTRLLPGALRDGDYFGTQTFGQALKGLIDQGLVSQDDAMAAADNPEELRLELKGIVRGGQAHRLK